MTTTDIIQAVEVWAVGVVPSLSSFDHPPEELTSALPIVMAELQKKSTSDAPSSSTLPGMQQYQHTYLRVWEIDLIILSDPNPAWTASHALYGFVDALDEALLRGVVLGDNVVLSQFHEASFDPPEIEYSDGTIARQVTFRITVGQPVGA